MSRSVVEFDDVSFAYGATPVLCSLSFKLHQGERLGLVGPSGCGKSTLLRLALNLLNPTCGEIHRNYTRGAMVFQDGRLLPWKNVLTNVTYSAKVSDSTTQLKARRLLSEVGLNGYENRYPSSLSGGEQQRVQLARALLVTPTLLVLDEFTSALDEANQHLLEELLLHLWADHRFTYILVTHNISQAKRLTDRVMILPSNKWIPRSLSETSPEI